MNILFAYFRASGGDGRTNRQAGAAFQHCLSFSSCSLRGGSWTGLNTTGIWDVYKPEPPPPTDLYYLTIPKWMTRTTRQDDKNNLFSMSLCKCHVISGIDKFICDTLGSCSVDSVGLEGVLLLMQRTSANLKRRKCLSLSFSFRNEKNGKKWPRRLISSLTTFPLSSKGH